MSPRTGLLDPAIVAEVRRLLEDRRPGGVARQEVQGLYGLDPDTARSYLREAGAIGHGGRGARWYLPTPIPAHLRRRGPRTPRSV